MIKISVRRSRNSPPVDTTDVEFNTQSKVSGCGLSTPDNSIGPAGDPFRGGSSQPRHAMEEGTPEDRLPSGYEKPGYSIFKEDDCGCQCEDCAEESEGIKYFEEYLAEGLDESLLYEKKDRCYYQAKQKYDVFPSAYASGYIVRCRKGKVGRKKKANEERDLYEISDEFIEALEEGTFDKEKKDSLKGWFDRQGAKGKSKGWVDCNTCRKNPKTGRKTCKTCGRQKGEKRSKYPACRPTPSACNRRGTSKKRGPMRVSWKKKKKQKEE